MTLNQAIAAYIGNTAVDKIMLGNNLIWQSGEPVPAVWESGAFTDAGAENADVYAIRTVDSIELTDNPAYASLTANSGDYLWSVKVFDENGNSEANAQTVNIHSGAVVTINSLDAREEQNFFNAELEQGTFDTSSGAPSARNDRVRSTGIELPDFAVNVSMTINCAGAAQAVIYVYDGTTFKSGESFTSWANMPRTFTVKPGRTVKFAFRKSTSDPAITPSEISDVMLSFGNSSREYTPYIHYNSGMTTLKTDDPEGNLFDEEAENALEQGSFYPSSGAVQSSSKRVRTAAVVNKYNAQQMTINCAGAAQAVVYIYDGSTYKSGESLTGWANMPRTFSIAEGRSVRFAFRKSTSDPNISPSDISDVMLSFGANNKPYRPYPENQLAMIAADNVRFVVVRSDEETIDPEEFPGAQFGITYDEGE